MYIEFFHVDKLLAEQRCSFVPTDGSFIQLNGKFYRVISSVWNVMIDRVQVYVRPVNPSYVPI